MSSEARPHSSEEFRLVAQLLAVSVSPRVVADLCRLARRHWRILRLFGIGTNY